MNPPTSLKNEGSKAPSKWSSTKNVKDLEKTLRIKVFLRRSASVEKQ